MSNEDRLNFLLHNDIEWSNRPSESALFAMTVLGLTEIRQFTGMSKIECLDKALSESGWWLNYKAVL